MTQFVLRNLKIENVEGFGSISVLCFVSGRKNNVAGKDGEM